MTHRIARLILAVSALLAFAGGHAVFAQSIGNSTPGLNSSFAAGKFIANYYGNYTAYVVTGNTTTGSASIVLRAGYVNLPDNRGVVPFAVGVPIVISDASPELVTPTAVSGCGKNIGGVAGGQDAPFVTCTITASFTFTHGAYANVLSATNGVAEAQIDAFQWGGGVVVLAPGWSLGLNTSCTGCFANKEAVMAAILPLQSVSFEDDTIGTPRYWNIEPSTTSFIATPSTLTATTVGFGLNGAGTTGGTYTGASTYHACVAYVDIAGNEGACSADFSGLTAGTGSTNQIGFSAPAASTGAVGYTVYISLASGSYALAYQVPLTSSVCTLTKLEVITPACAVTNATYGQTGSSAVVSALTVNTSPIALQLGGGNNQVGTGNSGAHTTYAYASSAHLGAATVLTANLPFTATAGGASSTNPVVMATLPIPANFLNQVGKTIRVCAKMKQTLANSPTIENWQVYWDGAGSDTAGSPVEIANIQGTATFTNVAYNGSFCESFTTTVSGAGVTAGSIIGGANTASMGIASAPTNLVTMLDTFNAATASLNLAGGAGFTSRLHIVTNHTTGADGASQVLSVTVEIL
jgi:hypothetical protein